MPIISLYTADNVSKETALQVAESMRSAFSTGDFQHDVEVRRFKTDILLNANGLHADVRFRKDDFWTDHKIAELQQVLIEAIGKVLRDSSFKGKYSCLVVAEPLGSAWSQQIIS